MISSRAAIWRRIGTSPASAASPSLGGVALMTSGGHPLQASLTSQCRTLPLSSTEGRWRMATQSRTTGLTYADLEKFPEDNFRRELIDGELIVTAAPNTRHQRAVLELGAALLDYTRRHGGEV